MVDFRHRNVLVSLKYFVTVLAVLCLFSEVELQGHSQLHFFGEPLVLEVREEVLANVHCDVDEPQVAGNLLFYPLVLHFHSHYLAGGAESCLVHLSEGGTGERLLGELGENVLELPAKLRFYNLLYVIKLGPRSLHEHRLEGADVLFGQKHVELTQHLPDLNVGTPIFAETVVEVFGSFLVHFGSVFVLSTVHIRHPESCDRAPSASHCGVEELVRVFAEFRVLVGGEGGASHSDDASAVDQFPKDWHVPSL